MKFDIRKLWNDLNLSGLVRNISMNDLLKNFLEGLLILVPVVVTMYVVFFVFTTIDGWLNLSIPGIGFLVTIGIIILVGRLGSNVFVKRVFESFEEILIKAPFVKLLYTSIKDLIAAFMGEKKRFDQPVIVMLIPGGQAGAIGFVTRQSLRFLGLTDHVAVYFPQSYNFAGNLLVFPRDQVRPLNAESSEVMTFLVSGGVSGGVSDGPQVEARI